MIRSLITVLIEMSAARGSSSFLATPGLGLSTYSTNILTLLSLPPVPTTSIVRLGPLHERRNDGMDRRPPFYDMYRGRRTLRLGSGLTIACAVACLYFTLAVLPEPGIPAAIGVLVSTGRLAEPWRPAVR